MGVRIRLLCPTVVTKSRARQQEVLLEFKDPEDGETNFGADRLSGYGKAAGPLNAGQSKKS